MNTTKFAPETAFHPSVFEVPADDLKYQRTFDTVAKERVHKVAQNTPSPGKYNLTSNDDEVSGSNTRYLFKNQWGETPLTFLFFSGKNIDNLQNLIKFVTYNQIGQLIDKQSDTELMIIMRSIFLEYSAHPKLPDESMTQDELDVLFKKYTNEVARLNELVVNAVVPMIASQLQQYMDYIKDASQQPYQRENPKSDSIAGQKEYRSITQVLTGGVL
jgi:hypothetical protein